MRNYMMFHDLLAENVHININCLEHKPAKYMLPISDKRA